MLTRHIDDIHTKRTIDLFNGLFDDFFGGRLNWNVVELTTPTEVRGLYEYRTSIDNDGMTLEVDLPGIAPGDVSLWASGNKLIVKTQRGDKQIITQYAIYEAYNIHSAKASMVNGQLKVRLNHACCKEPKQIDIVTG